jgi:uncharacterized protein (TIGR01777 family)
MKNILIAGGSGLVGKRLTEMLLDKGYNVTILTRSSNIVSNNPNIFFANWNTDKQTIDEQAVSKADAIINLAGAGVADKRWSIERKKEIVDSRVNSGRLIVNALQRIPNNVNVVVNASAIGWYAPNQQSNEIYQEEEPANTDFLGETCKQWEQSVHPISLTQKRLVKLRIGIVLSKHGGALKEFLKPLKFGVATILGSGKQKISWIHIDDLCRMFIAAVEQESMNGVYNAVSPMVTTNSKLNIALAKKLRGKFYIPIFVPKFLLKIVLGELSVEVLKSSDISCKKIHDAGFQFLYPSIESAFEQMFPKK